MQAKRAQLRSVEKELKKQGVSGPRLSHRVTLPGKDIMGRNRYYNMTPGEVAEFEAEFMPQVIDILNSYLESDFYNNLPANKRPAALQRRVHLLNEAYGASKRRRTLYRDKYLSGKLKPSGTVGSGVEKLQEEYEAEQLAARTEESGKAYR